MNWSGGLVDIFKCEESNVTDGAPANGYFVSIFQMPLPSAGGVAASRHTGRRGCGWGVSTIFGELFQPTNLASVKRPRKVLS